MARALASASGQYLQNGAAVLTAMPLTIACWIKPTNFTAANAVFGLYDSAVANTRYEIFTVLTTGIVRATHSDNSALATANTSVAATAGAWNHAAGVFVSATSRTAYLNAGSSGSSATNVAGSMAGLNNTTVGLRANSSVSSHFNGSLAEPAIWNVALAQADLSALAAGVCPLLVRPDALVFYAPLMGLASPEPDYRGRFSLTLFSAPTASAHQRIYYPTGLHYGITIPAVAASGAGPYYYREFVAGNGGM